MGGGMKALVLRVPPGSPVRYDLTAAVEFPHLPEPLRIELEYAHRTFLEHAQNAFDQRGAGNEFQSGIWRKLAIATLVCTIKRCASTESIAAAKTANAFDAHREIAAFLNLQLCAMILTGGPTSSNLAEVREIIWNTFRMKPPSESMALSLEFVYRAAGGYNQLN